MLRALTAAALAIAATAAEAGDSGFTVQLGPGVKFGPAYFGSADYGITPTGKFRFGDGPPRPGLSAHGAFRFVGARIAADHAELAGMEDVGYAVELGGGLGYEGEGFGLFADIRQGFFGHNAQLAEFGGDLKYAPSDRLSLSAGPRALFATAPYFDAYFNVTPAEAGASSFAAYSAGPGIVSASAHFEARYALDDNWALIGTIDHEMFLGGAAASPIVQTGSAHQTSLGLILTRKLSF
ncbi:MAG: MipA/OmpV family protein [Maritimibacter sp.]|nr:MipA/OmpV family protein [Maritimibacter sp.]